MKPTIPATPKRRTLADGPYMPAPYEQADAVAFDALQRGVASPEQQKRTLDWLITKAAATYEFHYYPSDRDTAFALGRAFVGQQVVKLLALNQMALRRTTNVQTSTPASQA